MDHNEDTAAAISTETAQEREDREWLEAEEAAMGAEWAADWKMY